MGLLVCVRVYVRIVGVHMVISIFFVFSKYVVLLLLLVNVV